MKNRKIQLILVSMALLGMLSGCGKQEETEQAENSVIVAETQAETEAEQETEMETKSISETEEKTAESVTETESVAETGTETATTSGETQQTTNSGNSGTTPTATEKAAETVAPEEEEVVIIEDDGNDNTPDVPAEVVVENDPRPEENINAPDPNDAPAPEVPKTPDTPAEELSMTVNYQGYALTVGESAKAFVEAVPPTSQESAPSCYGNGENINYYYDDLTIYVWNEDGNYMIYGIDIMSPGIVSVNGLDIGSAATFDGEKKFDMGDNCNIMVIAAGGSVVSISYNKDL